MCVCLLYILCLCASKSKFLRHMRGFSSSLGVQTTAAVAVVPEAAAAPEPTG